MGRCGERKVRTQRSPHLLRCGEGMVAGNTRLAKATRCEQRRFRRKEGNVSDSERFWRRALTVTQGVKRQNSYLCARPCPPKFFFQKNLGGSAARGLEQFKPQINDYPRLSFAIRKIWAGQNSAYSRLIFI